MRGHSRSKNGVAPLAYDPRIHVFLAKGKTWMARNSGLPEFRNHSKPKVG
jgi:hypothetical protein